MRVLQKADIEGGELRQTFLLSQDLHVLRHIGTRERRHGKVRDHGGTLRPLHVIAPPGTIVNALPPAAVGAGNVEVSQRVADVCLGALAAALPGRLGAASQGTMNNLLIGNDRWVYYETVAGGQGGRPTSLLIIYTPLPYTGNRRVERWDTLHRKRQNS